MLARFKEKFRDQDKCRFLESFISLLVIQGANYVLLLIIPLFSVLGLENSGSLPMPKLFVICLGGFSR